MKLIIGLGNPGKKYETTWHNVGFLAIDALAKSLGAQFTEDRRFTALVTEGMIGRQKVILAKPLTFMNNAGQTVQALAHFYRVPPENIIVIHDEFDLPLGSIRISTGSSSAGHNGVKSIIAHLNSKAFVRLRIGIKPKKAPSTPTDRYVLKKIGLGATLTVKKIIKEQVVPAVNVIIEGNVEQAMNGFN